MRISDWSADVCSSDLTLTAEEIGRRFLKLIEGLEARSDLSLDRIKNDTGIALGRFPVPSENLTYYAYSNHSMMAGFSRSTRTEERCVGKECVSTCRSRR